MVLTDGMKITIDGEKGLVFEGKKEVAAPALPPEKTSVTFARLKPVTATEVKVNVSIPKLRRELLKPRLTVSDS